MDDGWLAPGHEGRRPEPEPYAPVTGLSPVDPDATGPGASGTGASGSGAPGPYAPGPAAGQASAFATTDRHRDRVLGGQGYETPAYRNDSFAAASMVLGVIGVLVPGVCLLAVVCGHVARRRLRRSYEGGRGLAVAGLALGYTMTAVWLGLALLVLSTRALL